VRSEKVFCIGSNKTGTTSVEAALKSLGFIVGNQAAGELLIQDWAKRDFRSIIELCNTAEAFQDIPFSLDYTYVILDQAFPHSKFILTVRDSSSEWFSSLSRYHAQIVGKGRLPTADDLKEYSYRNVGWLWQTHALIFGCNESNVWNRELYIRQYESHRDAVIDYFRHRPDDLLVFNLSHKNAMERLCQFLGVECNGRTMPHLNASREAA
jgi:hypothetical protein